MKKGHKTTDCLFIQPPFSAQGILPHSGGHTVGEGLLSICTFLGSKGFSTEIFCVDEIYLGIEGFRFNRKKRDVDFDLIRKRIEDDGPRVVAVSALTPQYPFALKIIKICKEVDPGIITVIGGPHVTFTDMKVFKDSRDVDIVVRGEGEWTVLDIMRHVSNGKPFDDVPGITFRKGGDVVRNADRPMQDIGSLPPVDYSKVNPAYLEKCNFFLTFTRGCPFNCSYCVEGKFWGDRVRVRDVNAVLEEVRYLTGNYKTGELLFLGSVFNAPEDFFLRMCEELKKIDISGHGVSVLVGAAYLPEEHIRLMKEAGIEKLLLAVESASPEMLKRMNKRITFELVVEKCKLIKKYGLQVGTFWLFGHPGETEESAQASLDAMVYLWEHELNDKQEVAAFIPYPGIPLMQGPWKDEVKVVEKDLSLYGRFDKPVIDLDTIPYERLCEICQESRQIAQYWMSCGKELFAGDVAENFRNMREHIAK